MSLKISSFYLNTLLGGLVSLLTFVLVLLYMMQSGNVLPEKSTFRVQNTLPLSIEVQEIEKKIYTLENLISKEKKRARIQKNDYDQKADKLNAQISELKMQLENSRTAEHKVQEQLINEKNFGDKLTQQLDNERSRYLEQEIMLASTESEILALGETLYEEKQFTQSVRAKHEKDKLKMLTLAKELEQKKRELVRKKRELTKNKQALAAKIRELTISHGKISDEKRKNQNLSRQLSKINEDVRSSRQMLAREQKVATR